MDCEKVSQKIVRRPWRAPKQHRQAVGPDGRPPAGGIFFYVRDPAPSGRIAGPAVASARCTLAEVDFWDGVFAKFGSAPKSRRKRRGRLQVPPSFPGRFRRRQKAHRAGRRSGMFTSSGRGRNQSSTNSQRRFFAHASSLWRGSSGRSSP